MTVQELYDFAKERNILDYEIEAQYADDGGYYYGSRYISKHRLKMDSRI